MDSDRPVTQIEAVVRAWMDENDDLAADAVMFRIARLLGLIVYDKDRRPVDRGNPYEGAAVEIKTRLVAVIKAEIERRGLSQNAAAKMLQIRQGHFSEILNVRLDRQGFTIDFLVSILEKLGRRVDVSFPI